MESHLSQQDFLTFRAAIYSALARGDCAVGHKDLSDTFLRYFRANNPDTDPFITIDRLVSDVLSIVQKDGERLVESAGMLEPSSEGKPYTAVASEVLRTMMTDKATSRLRVLKDVLDKAVSFITTDERPAFVGQSADSSPNAVLGLGEG